MAKPHGCHGHLGPMASTSKVPTRQRTARAPGTASNVHRTATCGPPRQFRAVDVDSMDGLKGKSGFYILYRCLKNEGDPADFLFLELIGSKNSRDWQADCTDWQSSNL